MADRHVVETIFQLTDRFSTPLRAMSRGLTDLDAKFSGVHARMYGLGKMGLAVSAGFAAFETAPDTA